MALDLWYANSPLDRISHLRTDDAWIFTRRGAAESRIVPMWRNQNLVHNEEDRALMPTVAEAGDLLELAGLVALLGEHEGVTYFAADLSQMEDPYQHPFIDRNGAFEDLRKVGPNIPREEGSILAHARGLLYWHSRTRFCSVCGSPTAVSHAGHQRNCTSPACKASHFPRTDPAVIMLVYKGDMCLLGRTKNFPARRYSTLAGFVEPGESLEAAVRREVMEEVGIRIGRVDYLGSQPWPFPASLMLGFHAEAETTEIRLDQDEMDDARWVTREQMENIGALGMEFPRGNSIAFRLINAWLIGGHPGAPAPAVLEK